ncbi:MAG: hypothetical protein ACOYN0_19275, partial [Phycisphaerales bacterium]
VRAAERLDESFADDPLTRAELSEFIGWTLVRLEEYEQARPLVRFAAETRLRLQGPDHSDTIRACLRLAEFCDYAGPTPDSTKYYRLAMESCDRNFGLFDPRTLRVQRMLANNLASIRLDGGLATTLLEERLALAREAGRSDHPDTLVHEGYTGMLLCLTGRPQRGEPLVAHAVARARATLPPDDIYLATIEEFYGRGLARENPPQPEAQRCLAHAAQVYSRYFGPMTMQTLNARMADAGMLERLSKHSEARPIFEDVLKGFERLQGTWSDEANYVRYQLASIDLAERKFADAGIWAQRTINGAWVVGHRNGAGVVNYGFVYLAAAFEGIGDTPARLALICESIELLKESSGTQEYPRLLECMVARARLLLSLGRSDEAKAAAAEALAFATLNKEWVGQRWAREAENVASEVQAAASASSTAPSL